MKPDFNEELMMPSGRTRSMFEAPVPGQSLTKEPGKYPWESPPQYIYSRKYDTTWICRGFVQP